MKKILLTPLVLALTALVLPLTPALAAEVYLRAKAHTLPDPNGGADIVMWGYALCSDNSLASCGAATSPGPALSVPAGDSTLTVHLSNDLAVPTSLVLNGLIKPMAPVFFPTDAQGRRRVRSFDAEAAAGDSVDYTWTKVLPGTYLYQSGTQPQVQVQMGLYGALAQNAADATPSAPAQAYAGISYANQATLLYSEIDPALHAAVADGSYGTTGPTSTFNYAPKYFLINGQPYPGNAVITPVGPSGKTLLRLLNAGLTTHVPMINGVDWRVVSEDGKPYPWARTQFTALLPAAKTLDLTLDADAGGASYAIVDRRLNLSNNGVSDGGMLAFLQLPAAGVAAVPGGAALTDGNLPPVAHDDSYASVSGVTLSVGGAEGVLVNDDNTDGLPLPIRAVAATGATSGLGSFALSANGSFIYTPAAGFSGVDSFSYSVTDGKALSDVATVSITVTAPIAPSLALLDDFNRADAPNLGSGWSQTASTTSPPDLQVLGNQATAVSVQLGGLAIWNAELGESQGASFAGSTALVNSALILKATGGTATSPANYVRVRCELNHGGELVVATMMGGSNVSVFVQQAAFAAPGCNGSGALGAVVDAKGMVTTFLNSNFVGGLQLPDVGAWKGRGKIGVQLQTLGGAIDDFSGASL